METARLEVDKCAHKLKQIPTAEDPEINSNPSPIPEPGSPTPEANVEAEDQHLQIMANADTRYNSLETIVQQVLLTHKITHIILMLECVTAFDQWLGAAGHELTVWGKMAESKDAAVKAKNGCPPPSTCWIRRLPTTRGTCRDSRLSWP